MADIWDGLSLGELAPGARDSAHWWDLGRRRSAVARPQLEAPPPTVRTIAAGSSFRPGPGSHPASTPTPHSRSPHGNRWDSYWRGVADRNIAQAAAAEAERNRSGSPTPPPMASPVAPHDPYADLAARAFSNYREQMQGGLATLDQAGLDIGAALGGDPSRFPAAVANTVGGVTQYVTSPVTGAINTVLGDPIEVLTGGALPHTIAGDVAWAASPAAKVRPPSPIRAPRVGELPGYDPTYKPGPAPRVPDVSGSPSGAHPLVLPVARPAERALPAPSANANAATLRRVVSRKARATFFAEHPHLQGKVRVHHAVEQKVLHWYPGLFDENELHALPNLRGIPNELNPQLHLSEIRKEWDQFYRENPTATREQFEKKVREIDSKFGHKFNPPRETDE